ncbi:hypothetical protein [Pseudomonas chlororaphis]|uniref:hypothetical protein n=1 Tax=Pseudomonas chlororaphis TaxID=587753 RepID=UPI000471E076|nr:hypothetical protein [Pseudomonas chlororaphis]
MDFLTNVFHTLIILVGLGYLARRVYLNLTEASRVAKSTQTLAEYLKKYPQCRTTRGTQCVVCNSMSIKNWGFDGPNDERRVFICNQCNTRLYRSEHW